MDQQKQLREHLHELLEGRSAHIALDKVLNEFPPDEINTRIAGSPHTAWELVEHIRIAQWDILEFRRDAGHVSPDSPDGYWNKTEGTPDDWQRSTRQILNDRAAMREMVADEHTD